MPARMLGAQVLRLRSREGTTMNSKLALGSIVTLAVAGLAWASRPVAQDAQERLATLEKQCAQLAADYAALQEQSVQGQSKAQADIELLLAWARAQTKAAQKLQSAVEDARAKGFTAGINPESRVALLDGLSALGDALKAGMPDAPAPAPAKKDAPQRRASTPAGK
jgi:hypothetical protein